MKLWERTFYKEILKGIFLFLTGCYLIYSLLDYSFRAKVFTGAEIPTLELLLYYGWQFILQLELLLPLAVMLTTIRLLCNLNLHRELTALVASGIPMRRLLLPFAVTAALCSSVLYLNYQNFFPEATASLHRFEDHYFYHRKLTGQRALNAVRLQDASKLLYHRYDSDRERFYDAFWIRSSDEIVRIKELSPYTDPPIGQSVDQLVRDEAGDMQLASSDKSLILSEMQFDHGDLLTALRSARSLSISDLWKRRPKGMCNRSDRESELLTQLHKKLAMPLFALLAALGPAPFCLRFQRRMPVLLLYGLSIMGFVTFLTLCGAAEILGEGHVFNPALALWSPVLLFFGGIAWPLTRAVRQ